MELQFSRTMLIVFVVTITAVLIEFNSTTDARRLKHVFISKNERKKRTMNARYVNTMQKSNSEERVKWIYPESGINTKKTMAGTKSQAGTTTDNSIKDTKNEQENLSYSTNSYLATNDSTAFSHHQDNSEHIGTIVGLTVPLLVVATVVVGLVFLCYYKKFLCFKRNEKCDLAMSSSPMLDK